MASMVLGGGGCGDFFSGEYPAKLSALHPPMSSTKPVAMKRF
jgi:hypothetical protein